jgi:hypothetical protein
MKSGKLNFLEPSGPIQACNGTAFPLPYMLVTEDFFGDVQVRVKHVSVPVNQLQCVIIVTKMLMYLLLCTHAWCQINIFKYDLGVLAQ